MNAKKSLKTAISSNDIFEIKRAWSDVEFGKEIAPHEDSLFPYFLELARRSDNILEVGAGTGRMIKILRQNGVKARFYSIDITSNIKSVSGYNLYGDARKMPFKDNSFDLVYSLGVVEHFDETLWAIKEHSRVAKVGGHVMVTTPHLSIDTFISYMIYVIKHRYAVGSFKAVVGRGIRLKEMSDYFLNAGLEIEKMEACGHILPGPGRLYLHDYINIMFPSIKYGAYLYCIGRKGT